MARGDVKDVRLKLNAGTTPDGFSEVVQVEDTSNVVFLPDGSAMQPREGSEIRRRDEIGFGSDRKVIYFIADPPDIDYGDMIALVNTKDGRNDVQATEVVRTTVTRSEQNPLPMPDLPDWDPAPANVILSAETFDSEGSTDLIDGFLWDKDSEDEITSCNLDGIPEYYATKAFRTKNYLCYVSCDDSGSPVYRNVYSWKLDELPGAEGYTLATTTQVCAFDNDFQFVTQPCCWAYAGDIVFVLEDTLSTGTSYEGPHDIKLYKVDLATGTVTSSAVTGLPSTAMRINHSYEDGARPVCTEGYLWCWLDAGANQSTLVKIDPSTSAVVASKDFTEILGTGTYAYTSYGMAPLPNGEMLVLVENGTTDALRVSADLQTVSSTVLSGGLRVQDLFKPLAFNGKCVAIDGGFPNVEWADVLEGTHAAMADTPVGVMFMVDADTVASVEVDGANKYLVKRSASTGAVISSVLVTDSEVNFALNVPNDAYGYYLLNVQGDRLT